MSGAVHTLTLLGPITVAMIVCAMAARAMIRHTRLSLVLIAIAAVASITTALDLLVLNHFMLVSPGDWQTIALISLYALGTGVVAAMIVARTTTNAIGRLVATARMLGENHLDARAGDVHASPELQLLAQTLDLAAERLARALEAERWAEAQRRDLMTSISHDLRTPLANLRAMVEAITDGVVADPETVRLYSTEMLASIERLVEMVEDLFELARMDVERFARDSAVIRLGEAVRHALDLTEAAAARRQVAVCSDLGSAAERLCSPRLSRVIYTLVENAVAYTPSGGRVEISASESPEALRVSVTDTGVGIEPENLGRVFEPLWRADPARSTSTGSGLGLALARRIVEALGGSIAATSTVGAGSRFDVSLPASGDH